MTSRCQRELAVELAEHSPIPTFAISLTLSGSVGAIDVSLIEKKKAPSPFDDDGAS